MSKDQKNKYVKAHCIKACKVKTQTLETKKLIIDGLDVKTVLETPSQARDYRFDHYEPSGVFGDRTPRKPEKINEEVFETMLLTLKENVIPQLCQRLKKGRTRLGLPQVPVDPDIVGTISLPVIFRAFPESTDPVQRKLIQFNTTLGWDMSMANTAFPLGSQIADQATSKFVGSISGNILTVAEGAEIFGLIQQGTSIAGAGIPSDIYIIDQLSKKPLDGSFFKSGTYLLGKSVGDVCIPEDVNLHLPNVYIVGTLPQGPRTMSIYLQYGYVDKEDGNVKVKGYDLGNYQFEPTIDFDPQDDPLNVQSWGIKFSEYRSITTSIAAKVFENMPDPDDTGCLQLVIIRETGIVAFFPSDCNEGDDDCRAVTTVVINPGCQTNCTANGNTSTATTSVNARTQAV